MNDDLPMNLPQIEAEQAELQRLLDENRAHLQQLQQRADALHRARVRADGEAEGIQADAWIAVDDVVEVGLLQRERGDSITKGDAGPAFRRYIANMARLHGYERGLMLAKLLTEPAGTRPEFDALHLLANGEARS